MLTPTHEQQLLEKHPKIRNIVGIDEVGRGCWAGPMVMSAYVVSRSDSNTESPLENIRDSKKISARKRNQIFSEINGRVVEHDQKVLTSSIPAIIISQIGLAAAVSKALHELVRQFVPSESIFVLDGSLKIMDPAYKWESITKGDDKIYSIACASIYAKEVRDNYMHQLGSIYPEYGFESHVGYGTAKHREALENHGVTPEHRTNYKPIAKLLKQA